MKHKIVIAIILVCVATTAFGRHVVDFVDGLTDGLASKVIDASSNLAKKAGEETKKDLDRHAAASQKIAREKQKTAVDAARQAGHRDRGIRRDVQKFKLNNLNNKLKGDAHGGGML